MSTYIGIDLGTSSVKLLLVDEKGHTLTEESVSYPLFYPEPSFSEQNPSDWLEAIKQGMTKLLAGQNRDEVTGISFSGQMHGLVILDENDEVIRPCILWNDSRSEKQTEYLNHTVGKEKISFLTANIAFAGFTAPKILWLKENEPQNFQKIDKILLPKDYIAYMLCGNHCTDASDASGTLLFDVQHREWSEEMCRICSVKREWLPSVYESYQRVGVLKREYTELWGLSEKVYIGAGAADNAAAAIGMGVVNHGECNISLGTSGTILISRNSFCADDNNALHSFCHANGGYYLMGCILSAASCCEWWMNVLQSEDYSREETALEKYMGETSVFFLPYLMGERSPHNDVSAKGAFIGIQPTTTRGHLTLAVMEGVAFALKDCVKIAEQSGSQIPFARICGGGAKSELWKKILANVLGIPIQSISTENAAAYGAAMLAVAAADDKRSIDEIAQSRISVSGTIYPDQRIISLYQKKYEKFKKYYPALKGLF